MPYDRSVAIAERHEALLKLVEAGNSSASALANALGVSEATVNRDVGYLRGKGHRIASRRHASGWAFYMESSDTPAPISAAGSR